ncbi:hypothetical protein KEM55_002457 [Ascosphaera atra]|nr:hypothetical protein KEM55_002457 [Ascosphaera atra]
MASSDVVRALREFTRDLKEKREAALFYHPDNDVFIFYPAGAEEWAFLDRGQKPKFPGDFELHFAVSTALPRMSEVPALRGTSPTKPIELEEGELEPEREEGMPLDPIFQDKDEDVSMSMDMSLDTEPSPTKPLSLPLFGASFVSSLDEQGVRALFKTRFRIDLSDLTAVNGDTNPSKYFYLGFPSNTSHEFDFLRITLEKCNMEVYSNQTGRDWLSFKRATEDVSGTILLHESFSDFSAMPGFAKALRQRINVFYTSLSRPLSGRRDEEDDSNVFDTNNDVNFIDNPHFNLIFPHGGAILITDDLILRHPDRTLQIVSWFTNFVKTKFRGTWKLLFRPNVEQWLLELASLKNDERYVALYLLIRLNVPQYPRTHLNAYLRPSTPESLDGCSDDEGQVNPFVSTKYIPQYNARRDADVVPALRGSTMEQRNTDQLIEWFSGWALMNAERFRRFVAVTSFAGMKPLDRWKKWTHIEIMDSKEFMKEFLRSKAYGVSSSNAVAAEAKRAGQQKQQQQQQQPQQQLSRAA